MIEAATQFSEKYATLDDVDAILLVADNCGDVVYVNKAITSILGYDPEEVMGDNWWRLTETSDGLDAGTRKSVATGMALGVIDISERQPRESPIAAKDGRTVWALWTNTRTEKGYLVGIAQDITEKKALEEELNRKNKENELLLKEIHHRVKNNLQIITSLLNLQFNTISDEQVLDALSKSKDRINSMALIHTKLYESGNLGSINFGEYMHALVRSIAFSYDNNNNINWTVNHQEASFDIDLSINLGLIINELLTNAYKHAFKGVNGGQIKVDLKQIGDRQQILIVEDNGIGMDENKQSNYPESLGLEIVKGLVEQINGTLTMDTNGGVKYQITFEA